MRKSLLLFIFISLAFSAISRDRSDTLKIDGGLGDLCLSNVKRADIIDNMLYSHINMNREKGVDIFYRVQIFFGDKANAYTARDKFVKKYPNISANIVYISPDFRVRVGNCKKESEALKIKHMIDDVFKDSYIIKEKKPITK